MAGTEPNAMPVSSEIRNVKDITLTSTPTSFRRGMFSAPKTRNAFTAIWAINNPMPPPTSASKTLSVSS